MLFSGNNFKLAPNVRTFSYELNGISMTNPSGIAEFGFSGTGQKIAYSFSGGKVYDFNGKYFRSISSGDSFSISGDVLTGLHRYYSDGVLVAQGSKKDFTIQKFFVNTTGCGLYSSAKLYSNITASNYGIQLPYQFYAGNTVTGRIFNNSSQEIRVFGSRFTYTQIDNAEFSGSITGNVPANDGLNFSILDVNSSKADAAVGITAKLETNIGDVQQTFSLQRLSNLTGDIRMFRTDNFQSGGIRLAFSGVSDSSRFYYRAPSSGLEIQTINYRRFDNSGTAKSKSITLHIQTESPTGSTNNTGTFITGYSGINSGFYSEVPYATFKEYGKPSGVSFVAGNLFSLGCGAVIPFTFVAPSGDGLGGTGKAYLRSVNIGLYGSTSFYTITGLTIESGGSGYNYNPSLNLITGSLGTGCYDVPRVSGASYIYYPFTGTGILEKQASYLYGELMTGVRILNISGIDRTGFGVTGLLITNIGSGYNTGSGFNPSVTISRGGGDAYAAIATASGFNSSGSFFFNTSGDNYSFTGNWNFKTGSSFSNLAPVSTSIYSAVTGYSGLVNLSVAESDFYVYAYYKQNTRDISPVIKITVRTDGPKQKSVLISGINYTNSYTGMLKLPSQVVNTGVFIDF